MATADTEGEKKHSHIGERVKETPILKPWQGARLIFPVLKRKEKKKEEKQERLH